MKMTKNCGEHAPQFLFSFIPLYLFQHRKARFAAVF